MANERPERQRGTRPASSQPSPNTTTSRSTRAPPHLCRDRTWPAMQRTSTASPVSTAPIFCPSLLLKPGPTCPLWKQPPPLCGLANPVRRGSWLLGA